MSTCGLKVEKFSFCFLFLKRRILVRLLKMVTVPDITGKCRAGPGRQGRAGREERALVKAEVAQMDRLKQVQ